MVLQLLYPYSGENSTNFDLDTATQDVEQEYYKSIKKENMLGEGAYSVVYRLKQEKEYAIKVIRNEVLRDEVCQNRVLSEVIFMNHLQNAPCILPLSKVFFGKHVMVITPLFGRSLRIYQDTVNHNFNLSEITKIFYQICTGLNAIHTADVIHCDLHPDNILIKDDLSVKISDFGIATQPKIPPATMDTYVTKRNYRAWELMMFPRDNYGTAVDIWSLGLVLMSLFTNASPIIVRKCDPLNKTIQRIVNMMGFPLNARDQRECYDFDVDPPEDVVNIEQTIEAYTPAYFPTQEILDTIHACLQYDPQKRPTARDLAVRSAWYQESDLTPQAPLLDLSKQVDTLTRISGLKLPENRI